MHQAKAGQLVPSTHVSVFSALRIKERKLTLTTALALAFGSTLTWTMRLPCFGAAVTTTSSKASGSSGLFWPPQAFTQLVRSRKADMPCSATSK